MRSQKFYQWGQHIARGEQRKKKAIAFLKKNKKQKNITQNPVYQLTGGFDFAFVFCIVLFHEKRKVWGKETVIELQAGHLAEPSKTLLGISVSLRVEFHSSSKDLTSRARPSQVRTPSLCGLLLSLTGLLDPTEHAPDLGVHLLCPFPPPPFLYTGLCSLQSYTLLPFCPITS